MKFNSLDLVGEPDDMGQQEDNEENGFEPEWITVSKWQSCEVNVILRRESWKKMVHLIVTTDCYTVFKTHSVDSVLTSRGKINYMAVLNNNSFTKFECNSIVMCYQCTVENVFIILPAKMFLHNIVM
jgi:hypothetical protein